MNTANGVHFQEKRAGKMLNSRRLHLDLGKCLGCNIRSGTPTAPDSKPTPSGRMPVPSPPHTSALGVPGETIAANTQPGERGPWRGALLGTDRPFPGMAENRNTMETPARYRNKLGMNQSIWCCTYCCTDVPHGGWVGGWVVG